jgi:hypothetical protein
MKTFYILITFLFLAASLPVSAQYENLSKDSTNTEGQMNVVTPQKKKAKSRQGMKRVYLGGNIGGGWSNYGGYFEISPTINYLLTQNLHMGLRFTYIYSSNKSYDGHKYKYHDYGASILARYHFLKFLYMHAEFQELNFDKGDSREWIPALFLGGGIYQHVGQAYIHMGILWTVLDNNNSSYDSPYQNPMITVGFGIGI